MAAPKPHYVDKTEFYNAMKDYKVAVAAAADAGKKKPQIPNYIADCVIKIANHASLMHYFVAYPYRDDMVQDAIENCIRYLENFDPEKSNNPFAYFTQISTFAFVRRIKKEKKYLYTKFKAMQHANVFDQTSEVQEHDMSLDISDDIKLSISSEEYMNNFITSYEDSMERAKEAAREKLQGKE